MALEVRDGPYVAAALLCERVLEDKGGSLSLIQLVDRVNIDGSPPMRDGDPPVLPVRMTLFLSLRPGGAKGRRTLKLRTETPAGTTLPDLVIPVIFEGERPSNTLLQIPFRAELEGTYWFDVLLEEKRLTRIPLQVVYRPPVHQVAP